MDINSTKDGCLVVALTGSIDLFSISQIRRALFKDLSEQPYALICDLSRVDHLDPVCAAVFATVTSTTPASRWPATSVALCGAQPAVAGSLTGCGSGLPAATRASRRPWTPPSPAPVPA